MRVSLSEPILGHLLAEKWRDQPDKPTARGTALRYSSAGNCGRQIAYRAHGAMESNPPDAADLWAPGIGTLIHEAYQDAVKEVYPDAEFEVSSAAGEGFVVSGSCDFLVPSRAILLRTGIDLGGPTFSAS